MQTPLNPAGGDARMVAFRAPTAMAVQLEALSASSHVTKSDLIREAVAELLKRTALGR